MKKNLLLILMLLFAITSCDKDDDTTEGSDSFYDGALKNLSANDLLGTWAIFDLGYQGETIEVPVNYQECGRDFLLFSENGMYTEYLFQSSDCNFDVNSLQWVVGDGVITLSNEFQQSEELVVTSLSNSQMTFKARVDFDNDGILDILSFYLSRYTPIDIDTVTPTFSRNQNQEFENLIHFNWQAYQGFNGFDRYEIYRSSGDNCSIANADLIFTTTDVSLNEFTDLTPPNALNLCYYLRAYTSQGLLGESFAQTVRTEDIQIAAVNLSQPQITGDTEITFNWQPSEDPYFSHYELTHSNYSPQIVGSGKQEYTTAIINQRQSTSYIDTSPPYLNNPHYSLYVYNIFGNRSPAINTSVTSFWQVPLIRPEIVGFTNISFIAVDYDEPVVYLYGRESAGNNFNIHRFNYQTNTTEAIANLAPSIATSVPMKLIDSGFGKELVFAQGNELSIYDALSLEFKYNLDMGFEVLQVNDFQYSDSGYWIITDYDNVFSFSRDNFNFDLIDEKPHYPNHQGSYLYQVFTLDANTLLVGHTNEANSYIYDLNASGQLTQEQIVPIPIKDNAEGRTQLNTIGNYLINFVENRLYSTDTYAFLESFGEPFNSSGLSVNGDYIFGSNNSEDWQITNDSPHKKEAVKYNRLSQEVTYSTTKGYPHMVFENYAGQIISISSGFKKENLKDNINNTSDIFIETVSFE
jgi:hypothetical protein